MVPRFPGFLTRGLTEGGCRRPEFGMQGSPASGARLAPSARHRCGLAKNAAIGCGWAGDAAILGSVIGPGFPDVLAAAQDGDEEAFTQLWLDGNSALLRYLRVTAPETAEDIAAETWVHAIRGLRRFRGDEAAWRAWLFTTARRRTIDQARRRSRLAGTPVHELPASRLPVAADTADVALERLSTGAVIALLAALPPLQAEVILLRVVAGLDTEAVARLVRRSPGAVRVAAHRGLRKLAQILTEEGVTL
jgi:RNA polymerase sigma-70 factor, ECF subfamily